LFYGVLFGLIQTLYALYTYQCDHATWFNDIGAALENVTKSTMQRKWDSKFCNTLLPGSTTKQKPDIILLDCRGSQNSDMLREWSVVHGVCEVTSQESFPSCVHYTIRQKSFLTFATQPDRRFALSLSFSCDKFQFTACDCAVLVTSPIYNVNHNALVLLCILASFVFSSKEVIGYNPTMHRGLNNIKSITVHSNVQGMEIAAEYMVLKKIFSLETMRGHTTQCWCVQQDCVEYVIKDSWCIQE
jgi:hypothetical protein